MHPPTPRHMDVNIFLKPFTDLPECEALGPCGSSGFEPGAESNSETGCAGTSVPVMAVCLKVGEDDVMCDDIANIVDEFCPPIFVDIEQETQSDPERQNRPEKGLFK